MLPFQVRACVKAGSIIMKINILISVYERSMRQESLSEL